MESAQGCSMEWAGLQEARCERRDKRGRRSDGVKQENAKKERRRVSVEAKPAHGLAMKHTKAACTDADLLMCANVECTAAATTKTTVPRRQGSVPFVSDVLTVAGLHTKRNGQHRSLPN